MVTELEKDQPTGTTRATRKSSLDVLAQYGYESVTDMATRLGLSEAEAKATLRSWGWEPPTDPEAAQKYRVAAHAYEHEMRGLNTDKSQELAMASPADFDQIQLKFQFRAQLLYDLFQTKPFLLADAKTPEARALIEADFTTHQEVYDLIFKEFPQELGQLDQRRKSDSLSDTEFEQQQRQIRQKYHDIELALYQALYPNFQESTASDDD